jgi:hypothetical protein
MLLDGGARPVSAAARLAAGLETCGDTGLAGAGGSAGAGGGETMDCLADAIEGDLGAAGAPSSM